MAEQIVSLTPSITETLYALGAGDRIVGVTDACDFPPEANTKPHVCSWFDPDMDRIEALAPDLVAGLETAHGSLAPALEAKGIRFVLFNPSSVTQALEDMLKLGALLDLSNTAAMVDRLHARLETTAANVARIRPSQRLSVSRVLEIGADDLIVAGPRSFQHDVIALAGGINVTTGIDEAYPKVSFKQFKSWDPEMVFICGSDKQHLATLKADPNWRALKAVRKGRLHQFPCGLTCRTGPRIVDMVEHLFQTLYART